MITVSLKLSALLGKRVVLTSEYEGYPAGSIAVIAQFVITVDEQLFILNFENGPASQEDITPLELIRKARLLGPGNTFGHSLRRYFVHGFPPRDQKFNLVVG